MNAKSAFTMLKGTLNAWNEDKAPRLGAALAYYTIFSIAPLLVIVIAIAGLVFGREATEGQIVQSIQGMVGPESAQLIQGMIQSTSKPTTGIIATVLGIVTILLGAAGLFGQLKDALNTIWGIAPKGNRGILGTLKDNFLSFTMVLGIGFLLLVSLVVSAGISAVSEFLGNALPGGEILWQVINLVISFGSITLLFAMIYKILPDAKIAYRTVWVGAAFTALLFTLGKLLLGLYLGKSSVGSAYGAAGSLVVLLVWIYYSAQLLFFGAEFTQVYANQYGHRVEPEEGFVLLTEHDRAEQGIPHREQVEKKAREQEQVRPATKSAPTRRERAAARSAARSTSLEPTVEALTVSNAVLAKQVQAAEHKRLPAMVIGAVAGAAGVILVGIVGTIVSVVRAIREMGGGDTPLAS